MSQDTINCLTSTDLDCEDYQILLGASSDGILLTDGNGVAILLNKAYLKLSGIPEEAIIGRNMKDVVADGYLKRSVILMVIEEKRTVTLTQTDLPCGIAIVTATPIFNEDGEIIRILASVRDMSEIYRLREELEKAQQLEELFYQKLEQEKSPDNEDEPVAVSSSMKEVFCLARKISPIDVTVLVLGESGVGKEIVANFIHNHSTRKENPFIAVNCGAIPEHLLESELFGYAGGAFTGASKNGKQGLFEAAENGTLFLDEIGELPLNLQVKILRVLEMHEITRIGALKPVSVNARILAATNRNLENMIKEGTFREDLYYRLNVIQLHIPPLRERTEDIAPLSMRFLNHFNRLYSQKKRMSPDILREFTHYSWPGNIRELKNVLERLVVVSTGDYLDVHELPCKKNMKANTAAIQVGRIIPISEAIEEVEKQLLSNAVEEYGSSRKIAAAVGINQATVLRKMKKYGITKSIQ